MPQIDRLSALMSRFELTVTPCDETQACFWILGDPDNHQPALIILRNRPVARPLPDGPVLISADVTWGGQDNPLLSALPDEVQHALEDDAEMHALAVLFVAELEASRCGVASVLNRLGEVLMVRLMRAQIQAGHLQTGLLAALADPRLSRAVVAIHDRPEQAWRLESLADEAGLSVSRFSDLFRTRVGQPPLAYLRQWRLILAKQDIERGDQIGRVANRYCYGSSEALSRAFSAHFGQPPRSMRPRQSTSA